MGRDRRRGRLLLAALLAAAATLGVLALLGVLPHHHKPSRPAHRSPKPNIVFVLTDDLSLDLLRYMPHVQAMEEEGMTFSSYFVTDSLCCPSRASIFTGDFPHNTKIVENRGPYGGYHLFSQRGEARRSFPVYLQRAGYETAMLGKYLNGYLQKQDVPIAEPLTYVPPGWSEWDVGGRGYEEFNYRLNENGHLHRYGHGASDYLTDVLARKAAAFIDRAALSPNPFFLEVATFAPHYPYTPAPRDTNTYPGLRAPRPPSFDVLPTGAPKWLVSRRPLDALQQDQIDRAFRRRVESVQAIDQMIGSLEHALTANGLARDTYIVFSSDNGLHTGEYRLMPGKMTAYDTDIRVPLVVVGPGVAEGAVSPAITENVDLARTFAAIAHTTMPSDGRSLLPLLSGARQRHWRNAALIEHRGLGVDLRDPDFQQPASGNPTTYRAMRTRAFLYVEYIDGEREFYDLRRDPFELHNLAGMLTRTELAGLHRQLARLTRCGGGSCWAAAHVRDPALGTR